MLIPNKHNGYSGGIRRLCMPDDDDDGGGAAASATQTQTINQVPHFAPEVAPYAQTLLGQAAALTDTDMNPYMQYQGERIAQFSPLQNQSYQNMALMQTQPQLQDATALAGMAGLGALNTQYTFKPSDFTSANIQGMMNPYMQNVVERQQQDAQRQADIARQTQGAQAARSGAFGGSGDYLMRGQAAGNLARQKGDIQAQGLNTAYNQAMQQYNTQNQQNAQQQQYGAGLGLQGLQTANQAAQNLANIGNTQYQQNMGINQMQNQYGVQQQAQVQQDLTNKYQDYLNAQNYPYKQLGFMSDMVRGLPLSSQSTQAMYPQAPGPSTIGQIAGLGLNAYGAFKAGGGMVHDYAEGGVTSDQNVEGILSRLSDQQLEQAKQGALARRDVEQANMIDAEIAMRASARSGIGAGIPPEFADQMEESMASGGIVAFADRGEVKETPGKARSTAGEFFDNIKTYLSERYQEGLENLTNKEAADEIRPGLFESVTPKERKERESRADLREKGTGGAKKAPVLTQDQLSSTPSESKKASDSPAPKVENTNAAPAQAAIKKPEALFSGPKPSKAEVKSAVAQFAEQRGATTGEKEGYLATALKLRDELGKRDQPILDRLNAAIEAQKPDEKALKERGFNQAISQFGAAMAERASRPGATFLGSAAGASPALASATEKTNSLIDAKKENYNKMQLDQAKYELALSQGNMQAASVLAGQIRQAQQQDQALEFNIAKAKDELALKNRELAQSGAYQGQMASRYETIGSLTRDIMQNEGLPYDKALEKAGRLMKPSGYAADVRAGTALNANLDKALEKIDAKDKYRLLAILKPDSPRYGPLKAEYEAEIRDVMNRYGEGGGQPASPSAARAGANSGQWGNLRVKP